MAQAPSTGGALKDVLAGSDYRARTLADPLVVVGFGVVMVIVRIMRVPRYSAEPKSSISGHAGLAAGPQPCRTMSAKHAE